jgi:PadR family transcriptional regulator PadR
MTKPAGPQMTIPVRLVLRESQANRHELTDGLQICANAGLPSGTVHPILEGLCWLDSNWEGAADAYREGRSGRRYSWLSNDGAERACVALAQAAISASTVGLRVQSAGGIA